MHMLFPTLAGVTCASLFIILFIARSENYLTLSPPSFLTQNCHGSLSVDLKIFFHDLLGPKPPDPNSLLQRARQIIKVDGGNSFVFINVPNQETRRYGVSMFHQLHCLEMLRGAVQGQKHNGQRHGDTKAKRGGLEAPEHDLNASGPMSAEDHLDHCLDYLAQGIMCSADDTLEPSFEGILETGDKVIIVDGVGNNHQCRSVDSLHEVILGSQGKPLRVDRDLTGGDTLSDIIRLADYE